jgi:hypothetical protein
MTRHPDGFGIAWREGGELRTEKFGPQARDEFRAALKRVDKRSDIEYVAHFRWATHGPKAESHSHPYEYIDPVEGRVLVFHNGVIDIATKSNESDTEVFVRDVLAHLPSAWWRNGALRYLVTQSSEWSKLVLMTATETVSLQDKEGTWDGGIWYSSSHKAAQLGNYGATSAWSGSAVGTPLGKDYGDIVTVTRAAEQFDRGHEFVHGGHTLSVVDRFEHDVDGAYEQALVCDSCFTVGDLYVINGENYIEMAHLFERDDDDCEDEDAARELDGLLPLTYAGSRAVIRADRPAIRMLH